jgi:hypothetical protein
MNVMRHDFNFPARAGAEKERGSVVDSADSLLLVWKNRAVSLRRSRGMFTPIGIGMHRNRLLAVAIFSLMAFCYEIVAAPELATEQPAIAEATPTPSVAPSDAPQRSSYSSCRVDGRPTRTIRTKSSHKVLIRAIYAQVPPAARAVMTNTCTERSKLK